MAVSTATLTQMVAAQRAVHKLNIALRDYAQGNPAPSVYPGRFSVAEVQALVTAAQTALTPLAAA